MVQGLDEAMSSVKTFLNAKPATKKPMAKKPAAGVSASSKLAKASTGGDVSSQYAGLMKKYEDALKPSKTENKAQKSLDKLTTSYEKGTAKAGQEVMPMQLITGEKKALLDQYGVQAGVYQRTIAEEQAKRGAASNVLSMETGLVEKQMAAEQAQAQSATTLQNEEALAAYKKSLSGGGKAASTKLQSVKKTKKDAFGGSTTVYGTYNPATGEYNWQE